MSEPHNLNKMILVSDGYTRDKFVDHLYAIQTNTHTHLNRLDIILSKLQEVSLLLHLKPYLITKLKLFQEDTLAHYFI